MNSAMQLRLLLSERSRTIVALIATLAAIFLSYRPGLSGPFVFDDYSNIINNAAIAVESLDYAHLRAAALSKESGAPLRPIAKLSFALNYYFAGGSASAYWFKVVNLVIHLINTVLVFWLARLLLAQYRRDTHQRPAYGHLTRWLPIVVAAAWGLHPLNLNVVLYVVQRMTSLATLFMLAGLVSFVVGRQLLVHSPRRGLGLMIAGVIGGTTLGLLAKEIAVLLPLYLVVIDYTFFRSREQNWPIAARRFHAVSIGVFVLAAAYYLFAFRYQLLAVYNLRDFTLEERLLTEARVLWFYVSLIIFPVPGRFSLFHDDIAISTALLSPWTTVVAVFGLFATVAIAIAARRRWPILSFAILWFLIGHAMESSIIGLEIAHEHRNYLPSLGPLLAITYGLGNAVRRHAHTAIIAVSAVSIISMIAVVTFVRANDWVTEETLGGTMAVHHPNSPRTYTMLGELRAFRYNDPLHALVYYKRAMVLAPNDAGVRLRIAMLTTNHVLADQLHAYKPSTANSHIETLDVEQLLTGILSSDQHDSAMPTLQSTFIDELAEILANRPVGPDARQALVRFGQCIVDAPHSCDKLSVPALRWYTAITSNPTADPSLRHYAILTVFDIAIWRQNFGAALHAADIGKKREPEKPVYDLMRANALILLKRYGEAELLLRSVLTNGSQTLEDKENVLLLQALLEQHRHGKQTKTK